MDRLVNALAGLCLLVAVGGWTCYAVMKLFGRRK